MTSSALRSTSGEDLSDMNLEWTKLDYFRETSLPSDLCPDNPTVSHPRLAKDTMYANAVLEAWKKDIAQSQLTIKSKSEDNTVNTIGARLEYVRQSDSVSLSGYVVIRSNLLKNKNNTDSKGNRKNTDPVHVPAIVLFHTGAGPQDIFLRWKADMIARDKIWGENGCVVLIADIVSDSIGWTWTDRDRYDSTRKDVLKRSISDACATKHEHSGNKDETEAEAEEGTTTTTAQRWKLRETISAALDVLGEINQVDNQRIGAMGWCMGGHPILELGRMKINGVKALITFHGVFDGITDDAADNDEEATQIKKGTQDHVLICNGKSDPFVSQENLEIGRKSFETNSWDVKVLNFDNVKHGFTNPAQDCNPSDAFVFNEEAAKTSWGATKKLLQKQLLL